VRGWRVSEPLPVASPAEPDLKAGAVGTAAPDSIRAQLGRILKSKDFDATERLRNFLSYVVEEALAGRADRIKAYAIAIEVFRRDATFDAHSDPIVRIEAGHLRRALDRYYLTAGVSDDVVISIPKGSYVPKFEVRHRASPAAPVVNQPRRPTLAPLIIGSLAVLAIVSYLAVDWMRGGRVENPALPRLLVKPFDDLTDVGKSQVIARGLTQEIIGQIAKFKDIVTISGDPRNSVAAAGVLSPVDDPRYVLSGDIEMTDSQFRLRARVLNRMDNSVIWANSYNGNLLASTLIGVETEIARQVATALGQPYGVIYQADASRSSRKAPDDWQAYACTLSYYSYRANLDAKTHPAVRKCLEDAVRRFPNYATAWALLSQTYVDEIRFRYPIDPQSSPASIDRALEAARRAVELDPENIRALQSQMFALYFHGEYEAALKVGEQAINLNPNDTELMGEYGYRLALSGDWARGCAMIDEARKRNPGPLAYYETGLALCSYFRGDFREAAMWITKTSVSENPNYHLIAAAIFAENGQAVDAAREREWLTTRAPKLVENARQEIAMRVLQPADVNRLVASLRKAGLQLPSTLEPVDTTSAAIR
jgi:TolB-like protein/Tfp pilus assembly protein PilF